MTSPTPAVVTLTGHRLAGTVPVRFRRASNWARTVIFGDATFGTDNHININGISYTLAGLSLVETDDGWQPTNRRFLRRHGNEPATDAATKAIISWAIPTAHDLANDHPHAFDETPLGHVTDTQWAEAHRTAAHDAAVCAAFANAHATIAAGHTTTTPTDDVGAIHWRTPRAEQFFSPKATAQQPAHVVATISQDDTTIAYVVDVRRRPGDATPDPNGGLIVPINIVKGTNR